MSEAGSIAREVRTGARSATKVVAEALERAEAAAHLNAFTRLDPETALERAAAIDSSVVAGADPGPLAGVPIALKDIIDQEGVPTTAGSSFLRDPAPSDSAVVTRLEAAGAVIIGRTGLHEFAYGFSSENDWWGPVRNPWDPAASPGGSSGGSAAAVAAGVTPIGIGTDTGGSVRVPASLCGLVGLKVTHGRVPLTGVFPLAPSLDTVGPMTRSVGDAALAYSTLAGHDPADRWSIDRPVAGPASVSLGSLSVGIPHPWVDRPLAPEQRIGFSWFIEALGDAGAALEHFDEPRIDEFDLPAGAYAEVADVHRSWFTEDRERYGPTIRDRLATLFDLEPAQIEAAVRWRAGLRGAFEEGFKRFDMLITPATAARSKEIGVDLVDVGAGPEPYRPVLSWFTPLVNQAGLPALVLPVEVPEIEGLPPSVQLIGPHWNEARLLAAGRALEALGTVSSRTPNRQLWNIRHLRR